VFVDPVQAAQAIVVRVVRDGRLLLRELCDSEEQAARVVDRWSEADDVECDLVRLPQ
jgi:hypothetical protein